MQGLTIQEPWASLLVKGKKQYETRDWQRNYRGLLAIHAGKQSVPVEDYPLGLSEILDDLGISQTDLNNNKGKIIAIATLKDIHLMTDKFINEQTELERLTGFWEPGLYAWELTNIKPLSEPIPARGLPGLWLIEQRLPGLGFGDRNIEQEILNQLKSGTN
ncbi:ASCH domain-containing protein [Planktothrix agardhii 1801]|uniref:ASCH domain-containing protein n=1 Tax=Planktothrix agardhii TaxID=1160 RepID=UPI001F1DBFEC|nr:ASCH domain-containing protein [Planktothrix agardhii]MCF3627470.1 ASCH domain-containing protein [Planktothrix agardhii 1801]